MSSTEVTSIRAYMESRLGSEIRDHHACPQCTRSLKDAVVTFEYPGGTPIGVPATLVIRWSCGGTGCEYAERHERAIDAKVRDEIEKAYRQTVGPVNADDVLDVRAALRQLNGGFRELFDG